MIYHKRSIEVACVELLSRVKELKELHLSSVVDPNTLNLDPDPGFWPNLDPDPDPG